MTTANAVALYWDFENLHASLLDETMGQGAYHACRYRPQDPLIDVTAIIAFAGSFGPIAINRAFANWATLARYRHPMLNASVELVQLFAPGASAKNGADISLCLDVMQDMARLSHVGTIIVVGADSDYMPLASKLKAAGRTLVGIGTRGSTNQYWARSCHQYRYYETLVEHDELTAVAETPAEAAAARPVQETAAACGVSIVQAAVEPGLVAGEPAAAATDGTAQPEAMRRAHELVVEALACLHRSLDKAWINKAALRPYIQHHLAPGFHEATYGYASFSDLLASMSQVLEVRRGKCDHELRLRAHVGEPALAETA